VRSRGRAGSQGLVREVNERICGTVDDGREPELLLVCECSDDGCKERIAVSAEEYKRLRENPSRFLVTPGHEADGSDRIVTRTADFLVVERER
jgi:hypothetical protein